VASAGFDDAAMVKGVRVDEDSLWLGFVEHVLEVREEKVWREAEFLGDEFRELFVSFGDADDLDVGAMEILLEEAADVAVDESGNADAELG